MKPSVGRIVHYVSYGTPGGEYKSECRAAIITETCDAPNMIDPETGTICVSLCVMNPEGLFFNGHVPFDLGHTLVDGGSSYKGGTWHWPERVDGSN